MTGPKPADVARAEINQCRRDALDHLRKAHWSLQEVSKLSRAAKLSTDNRDIASFRAVLEAIRVLETA